MEIINCPNCKYYYAPVCTFYKWLPMVSRSGFCYHAVEGKYEGKAPVVEAFIRSMAAEGYGVKNDKDRR